MKDILKGRNNINSPDAANKHESNIISKRKREICDAQRNGRKSPHRSPYPQSDFTQICRITIHRGVGKGLIWGLGVEFSEGDHTYMTVFAEIGTFCCMKR